MLHEVFIAISDPFWFDYRVPPQRDPFTYYILSVLLPPLNHKQQDLAFARLIRADYIFIFAAVVFSCKDITLKVRLNKIIIPRYRGRKYKLKNDSKLSRDLELLYQ